MKQDVPARSCQRLSFFQKKKEENAGVEGIASQDFHLHQAPALT